MASSSSVSKVSIVIPAYNREDYLSSTITSCLHQSQPIDEIIVIDNHSTDKTFQIAKKLASQHKQIKVFRNSKNIGMIANWNKGINFARNRHVALLHSDDVLPYYWCRDVKDALSLNFKRKPALYFGTVVCVEEKGSKIVPISKIQTFKENRYFKPQESIKSLWLNFYGNPGCSSALIYDKEVFEKLGAFDPSWNAEADQEFHIRLLSQYPSYHLNKELVNYRIHPFQGYDTKKQTESSSRSVDRILNSLQIQAKYLKDKSLIGYNYCGVLLYILFFLTSKQFSLAHKLFKESKQYLTINTILHLPRFLAMLLHRRYLSRYF